MVTATVRYPGSECTSVKSVMVITSDLVQPEVDVYAKYLWLMFRDQVTIVIICDVLDWYVCKWR
jgi:hypothetical protein